MHPSIGQMRWCLPRYNAARAARLEQTLHMHMHNAAFVCKRNPVAGMVLRSNCSTCVYVPDRLVWMPVADPVGDCTCSWVTDDVSSGPASMT